MKQKSIFLASLLIAVFTLSGCSPEDPFSLGEVRLMELPDIKIAEINEKGEINVLNNYETRGRYLNFDIPIERKTKVENIIANMKCEVESGRIVNSLKEDGNRYSFESVINRDRDFLMKGSAYFFGKGTVLNKGSNDGTEILVLKKEGLAGLSMGFSFKGEDPQKVRCNIELISRKPAYITSKTLIFNYQGIEGYSVSNKPYEKEKAEELCTFSSGLACIDFSASEKSIMIEFQNMLGYNMKETKMKLEKYSEAECVGGDYIKNEDNGKFICKGSFKEELIESGISLKFLNEETERERTKRGTIKAKVKDN